MFHVGFVGGWCVSDRFWLMLFRASCSMLVSLVGGVFRTVFLIDYRQGFVFDVGFFFGGVILFRALCSLLVSLVGGVFRSVFG